MKIKNFLKQNIFNLIIIILFYFFALFPVYADTNLKINLKNIKSAEFFKNSTNLSYKNTPPHLEIYENGKKVGYVFMTTDFVDALGYSGKPIHIAVGLDMKGVITNAKLIKHSEPVILAGIPEKKIKEFVTNFNGYNILEFFNKSSGSKEVDLISGASLTSLVIQDSITFASREFFETVKLDKSEKSLSYQEAKTNVVDFSIYQKTNWQTLLNDGSVKRRLITLEEINKIFIKNNESALEKNSKTNEDFIDLYIAPVSVPHIGINLLGKEEYKNMLNIIEPEQQVVLIFASGSYSFKGSSYVRGGIFDRIQLVQGKQSIRFRDKHHKRLNKIVAEGAPAFNEIGLFKIPTEHNFNLIKPFRLELLISQTNQFNKKKFLTLNLEYILPDYLIKTNEEKFVINEEPFLVEKNILPQLNIWKQMWELRLNDAIILICALTILTFIFFFQNQLVKKPTLFNWLQNTFMVFSVLWLGFYAHGQLSIINVFTFFGALMTEFRLEFFMTEPIIFVLWSAVAASMIFWGRGAYCGWLCPFGVLHELLNKIAVKFRVPQIIVPWELHKRLWALKYVIFLSLLGLSIFSMKNAILFSEVEPFKTVINMQFARAWPYVLYALIILIIGLFIERFFCRYLCPLGAALAIPGRMSLFDWLERRKECGNPCQKCARKCSMQAIHPDGRINKNECLFCMQCQVIMHDNFQCPPLIVKRKKGLIVKQKKGLKN